MSQDMRSHRCQKFCNFRKNAINDSKKIRRKNLLATSKVNYSEMSTYVAWKHQVSKKKKSSMTFHDFFINNEFSITFSRPNKIAWLFHDFWKFHDLSPPWDCVDIYSNSSDIGKSNLLDVSEAATRGVL